MRHSGLATQAGPGGAAIALTAALLALAGACAPATPPPVAGSGGGRGGGNGGGKTGTGGAPTATGTGGAPTTLGTGGAAVDPVRDAGGADTAAPADATAAADVAPAADAPIDDAAPMDVARDATIDAAADWVGGRDGAIAPDSAVATDSSAGADAAAGSFQLDWQDDFNAFDGARWQLMTHTWDGNLAQFSTSNVRFENGTASLLLTPEPSDTVKPWRGVEMRSKSTLTYGKIESRVRFAKGSGVVSGLVLIYTPWPADDWNELDVEYLGRYTDRIQFNTMVYTGPPVAKPAQQSVTPTQFPQIATLGLDPSADFHVYGIEWTPTSVRFTVDGQVKHTWSTEIARLKLPQNILLTIWASSAADWAGPLSANAAATSAVFDWIRAYSWRP